MKNYLLFFLFLLLAVGYTQAQPSTEAERKKHFNLQRGFAADGYDPVSYFDNKPLKGNKNITFTHKGIKYAFANHENLKRFREKPDFYEPQYGGWCAYAVGLDGSKVEINPNTYKIVDNKLYLFYNSFGNNTKNDWDKNEKKLLPDANKYWSKTK